MRRKRELWERNAQTRRQLLRDELVWSLAASGEAASALWQAERPRLVQLGLLVPDVVITPSAWTPQPPPPPCQEPLPPMPTVVDAARIAAELLAERPRLGCEDHVALGVYVARLALPHRELG